MDTPLLNALLDHIRRDPAPFHMPGHKGRMAGFEALAKTAALDVTELPDTGDLYAGADAIAQAEALWAKAWGFSACQFLTGGSTQGLHAALLLSAQEGKGVLVDRCCHRSVYNALGLFDLDPVYLLRRQTEPVEAKALAAALENARAEVKTVCITSPTYYGVLSDVAALAEVAHRHGARLVVDGAHGAHLPFLGQNPFLGADLVVTSAHKTLPVYGQGALLFSAGGLCARDLRWAASVCGTSSPSYPVMASMDWARGELAREETRRRLAALAETVAALRARWPSLRGGELDPLRLAVRVNARVRDGFGIKADLEAGGVFPEMADRDHVVFLFGLDNTPRDLARLRRGLEEAEAAWPGVFDPPMDPPELPDPPILDLAPARALTARRALGRLGLSEGCVCLQQVAPYPPGVPVIAPGERITKKGLAYLAQVGYNIDQEVYVACREEG